MHKVFLLAFVASIAAAISIGTINSPTFRPGSEYTYSYESQVLSGIRTVSRQMSGIKIHSTVRLQIHRNNIAAIKMENIKVFQINNELPHGYSEELLTDEHLTLLDGDMLEWMTTELTKPIKFRYVEGEVRDVETLRHDKLWSVNIKKGVISALQLKLNPKSSTFDTEMLDTKAPRSRFFDPTSNWKTTGKMSSLFEGAYNVVESDVSGDCETKYTVMSKTSEDSSKVSDKVITKVKNFDTCLNKHTVELGLFAGLPHYNSEKSLVEPSSESEYEISGDRHNFVIRKMKLTAKYFFRPYGQDGGHASTHIIQKLTLRGSDIMRNSFIVGPFGKEKKGLHMEIPYSSFTEENPISDAVDLPYKEIVEWKLNELMQLIDSRNEEETTMMKLMQLNIVLRDMPYKALLEITRYYCNKATTGTVEFKKREIILDILPLLPSPHVAKILSELIKEERIGGLRASISINALTLAIKPSPLVVNTLLNLYNDLESRRSSEKLPFLKRSVLLGVGSVVNKMVNLMKKQNKPHPEVLSIIETVSSELERLLSTSRDEKTKMLIIKSMGNMGVKNVIPILKNIIENKSVSETIRIKAVCALRKLSQPFDKIVHPFLLSIFMNEDEPSILRIAAFKIITEGKPSFTTLQLITHKLKEERSIQVKTFVYSSLVNLATHKTNVNEIEELIKNVRKVLKTIRPIPVGLKDSKSIMIDGHSDRLNIGGMATLGLLKSKLHAIPDKMFASIRTNILGNILKVGEFGVEGNGIEEIIRRLVGPYGTLNQILDKEFNIYDVLKPLSSPEMGYVRESIRDVFSKKSFEVRSSELRGLAYISILGQELQFIDIQSSDVEEISKMVISYLPEWIEKFTSGHQLDVLKVVSMTSNSIILPTPIGLPLSLNMSFAGLLKLNGALKVSNLPQMRELMKGDFSSLRDIEIESTAVPCFSSQILTYMGVDMRFIRSGVAVKGVASGSSSVAGKFNLGYSDNKITARYSLPRDIRKSFRAELVPLTFIVTNPVPTVDKMSSIYSMKEINTKEILLSIPLESDLEEYGVRMSLRGEVVKCYNVRCPYVPLNGKHSIHIKLATTETMTEEFYIKLSNYGRDSDFGRLTFDREMQEGFEYKSQNSKNWKSNDDESAISRVSLLDNDDFERISTDSSITTPRKIEVSFECGSKRGKHFRSQVTWMHGEHWLQHQIVFQTIVYRLDGTPLFKGISNNVIDIPRGYELYKPSSLESLNGKTLVKSTISYKCSQYGENTFTIQLMGLDSATWTNELEKVDYVLPEKYLMTPPTYRYALTYNVSEITPEMKRVIILLGDLVKAKIFWRVSLSSSEVNFSNKGSFLVQYIPRWEKLTVIVKSLANNNYVLTLPIRSPILSGFMLPSLADTHPTLSFGNHSNRLGEWSPGYGNDDDSEDSSYDEEERFGSYYGNMESFLTPKSSPSFSGKCKVSSDRLTTFDGVPLLLPERPSGSCDIILAHDCSERKLFSITGSLKEGRWWGIKVLVPELELLFVPVVERRTGTGMYTVRSNGNSIDVNSRRNIEIYNSEKTLLIATIMKFEEGLIVKLHELGLKLKLKDGEYVSLKISPASLLQGQVCGLCGDFNYDQGDELKELSSGKVLNSRRSFTLDKVLPSETCNMNEYENMLISRYESECKKTKTIKIDRMIDGVEKECFSTRPVATCAHGCSRLETTSTTVPFTCLSIQDSRLHGLNEVLYREKIVREVANMPVDYEQTMDLPNKCSCEH